MKVRNGFVSNSSSSSFIIAYKKGVETCPVCGRGDPDILDVIQASHDDSTHIDETELDGILEQLQRDFWWNYDGGLEKLGDIVDALKEYDANEEWAVASATISNHDDYIVDKLDKMEKVGRLSAIWRDE